MSFLYIGKTDGFESVQFQLFKISLLIFKEKKEIDLDNLYYIRLSAQNYETEHK